MPDIDVDVPINKREKIIEYIKSKMDNKKVLLIVDRDGTIINNNDFFGPMPGIADYNKLLSIMANKLAFIPHDIDLYIHNVPSEIQDKLKIFKESEFDFIDYSIKGTEKWPIHWDVWLDEWAKLANAKYFEEILGNLPTGVNPCKRWV
jgi:hypothetical protein